MFHRPVSIAATACAFLLICAPIRAQQATPPQTGTPPVTEAANIPAAVQPVPAATAPHAFSEDGPPSMAMADLLVARGRYLAAIRMYGQLPVTADAQNRMGVASERMLMFDQAQKCFETALKLDPKLGDAWNNLGTVMHSKGDLGKAEKYYRKAIKLKPGNADTYQNLGALYYGKRNYGKGDAMYREAIRLDPQVMERTAEHGVQTAGGGKFQAEMHYHQACTFAQSGNQRLALDYLRRSILEGFHDRNRLLHEASFADLRTSEPFLRMVDDLKSN